jgi:hypothetical protein
MRKLVFKTPYKNYRMQKGNNRKDGDVLIGEGKGLLVFPKSRQQLFNEANWGKEVHYYTNVDDDIRPNDKIEIKGQKYGVEQAIQVDDPMNCGYDYLRVVLIKGNTAGRNFE